MCTFLFFTDIVTFQAFKKDFQYPRAQFFVNGWFPNNWWEGSTEEQIMLEKNYDGCTVENRRSIAEYTLSVSNTGTTSLDYSAVADSGYVSYYHKRVHSVPMCYFNYP